MNWTVVVGRMHGQPGYEGIATAFLLYLGNQIGQAMPLYVAKAAAERLNEIGATPEGWK